MGSSALHEKGGDNRQRLHGGSSLEPNNKGRVKYGLKTSHFTVCMLWGREDGTFWEQASFILSGGCESKAKLKYTRSRTSFFCNSVSFWDPFHWGSFLLCTGVTEDQDIGMGWGGGCGLLLSTHTDMSSDVLLSPIILNYMPYWGSSCPATFIPLSSA